MFQKFIYNFIQSIKHLYEKLDMAYEQTYTDNVISYKLSKERIRRKKEKKLELLAKIKKHIQDDYFNKEHEEMPDFVAEAFAKDFYAIASARGDIDELGNFIGDINLD